MEAGTTYLDQAKCSTERLLNSTSYLGQPCTRNPEVVIIDRKTPSIGGLITLFLGDKYTESQQATKVLQFISRSAAIQCRGDVKLY